MALGEFALAQRRQRAIALFCSSMSHPSLTSETSVPEALAYSAAAPGIFIAHHTACVGCPLGRFCTLRDVALTYGLSLEALLAELENAALADPNPSEGVRHETTD